MWTIKMKPTLFVFCISTLILNLKAQQQSTEPPVRYSVLLREIANISTKRTALQAKLSQYKEAVNQLENQRQQAKAACRCYDDSAVAFTAHLDQEIANLGADQAYPFDNVTLNEGNAYDARHAQFRAPYNGTYRFFASLSNNAGYAIAADFMLNGSPLVKIRTGNPNQVHTATNGVIVHMTAGDDLWIQHDHDITDNNRLYHQEGYLTTFSGYLVSRD